MTVQNGSFEHLYTLTEIAFIYMIDTSTVRKMVAKGKIKKNTEIKKFGGTWVMTEQSMVKHFGFYQFEDYIKNRKAEYLFKTGEINYKQKFEMENDLGLF